MKLSQYFDVKGKNQDCFDRRIVCFVGLLPPGFRLLQYACSSVALLVIRCTLLVCCPHRPSVALSYHCHSSVFFFFLRSHTIGSIKYMLDVIGLLLPLTISCALLVCFFHRHLLCYVNLFARQSAGMTLSVYYLINQLLPPRPSVIPINHLELQL